MRHSDGQATILPSSGAFTPSLLFNASLATGSLRTALTRSRRLGKLVSVTVRRWERSSV